jgi:type 1 glutamine amidotransferase
MPPGTTGGAAGASTTGGGGASAAGAAGAASLGGAGSPSGGTGGGGTSGASGAGGASAGTAGMAGSGGSGGSGGSAGSGGSGGSGPTGPKRVLLYYYSTLNIASINAQLTLLEARLETWGYEAETSKDPAQLTSTNLARFSAVAMVNTCFEPFGMGQQGTSQTTALTEFVAAGGGLFGTHCASVTFQSAKPPHAYNTLLGGRGGGGSYEGKSPCTTELQHPTTQGLTATFDYTGNLDNADYVAPDTQVLVKCRLGGDAQKETAVSWFRTSGKGRVFFTNFAKEAPDLESQTLGEKHILPGLSWVLGR